MGHCSLSRDCCIREAAGCRQKEFFLLGNYTLLVLEVWFPSPQHPLFFRCQETPVPHPILGSFYGTQTCMRQTAGARGRRGRERMGDFRTYQVTNSNGAGWQCVWRVTPAWDGEDQKGLAHRERRLFQKAVPRACRQGGGMASMTGRSCVSCEQHGFTGWENWGKGKSICWESTSTWVQSPRIHVKKKKTVLDPRISYPSVGWSRKDHGWGLLF